MKSLRIMLALLTGTILMSCSSEKKDDTSNDSFKYVTEQFADLRIQRYEIPGFDELSVQQKTLLYYLSQASLAGRDIMWDQNYKYNLLVRRTLEAIVNSYTGNRNAPEFEKFMVYTKRVWFSNGIHHHYSSKKFIPGFDYGFFEELVKNSDAKLLPLAEGQSVEDLLTTLKSVVFDPTVAPQKVNLDPNSDLVATSAVNFYEGVTQKQVEDYYKKIAKPNDPEPVSYGLNSKMVMKNGKPFEETWKVGGLYDAAISKIVYWLEKAVTVAENDTQKKTLELLVDYYKTGNLKTWDDYNIEWVKDTASSVDAVNGFIETYEDPLGYRASYEAVVSFKDMGATKRIKAISDNAQWFEDNSPILPEHKKKSVKGITAKVITVVCEAGDASPSTPIGINLPNANWIRQEHGSKSVNLGNVVHSYNMASASNGMLEEFCFSEEGMKREKEFGALASDLHTDMHEVIGHASGQINPGVGTPGETLKNYASTLEEARADLVALYYIMDQKLVDIGVMPSLEVGKALYDSYVRNGLMTQLSRIVPGENIEQAHMRNRQLVSKWAFEKGKSDNVIEFKKKDGKTYVVVNDYNKLRGLFGELLKDIQKIESEGDFTAGKNLVEAYGVKVDPELHKEVLERYKKLNIAPYAGFINPKLVPVMDNGNIIDVKVEYPDDFTKQMLEYAKDYSFLPTLN